MSESGTRGSARTLRMLPTEEYFSIVRAQLGQCGQAGVRVTGNSMFPLLRHLRDSVVIVPPERVVPGDIVLFDRKNGRYALHRVIRMKPNGFSMMGDNQSHIEHGLPYDQIVGVVSVIRRDDRSFSAENFWIKFYAQAARVTAYPRMYLRTAARRCKQVITGWTRGKKA